MGTNVRKLLNLIVISGERRYFIFWKKKFEICVYFTPIKKRIVDCKTYNIKLKDLKLDFTKISSIKDLISWIGENQYHYKLIERHTD
jgi:hypothetical protein